MGKIILGLLLGFFIGIGCRWFDIPLPGPPKFVGALVIVSITMGYLGMDHLIVRQARLAGTSAKPVTTAPYCAGPTGLPHSHEKKVVLAKNNLRDRP